MGWRAPASTADDLLVEGINKMQLVIRGCCIGRRTRYRASRLAFWIDHERRPGDKVGHHAPQGGAPRKK